MIEAWITQSFRLLLLMCGLLDARVSWIMNFLSSDNNKVVFIRLYAGRQWRWGKLNQKILSERVILVENYWLNKVHLWIRAMTNETRWSRDRKHGFSVRPAAIYTSAAIGENVLIIHFLLMQAMLIDRKKVSTLSVKFKLFRAGLNFNWINDFCRVKNNETTTRKRFD